jgi:cyclic pyranopterin phosphate synthase
MLVDSYQRHFRYLRLSVTKVCNFRCTYCLPNGYQKNGQKEEFLSTLEIQNLLLGFAQLGFSKVRLTGGEPTVRQDIIDIVKNTRDLGSIESIALTTNGYRLNKILEPLYEAGLTDLNVSIDSLDSEVFKKVTGSNTLPDILEAIDRATKIGLKSVKVNSVLMKGINSNQLESFMDWVKDRPVAVRFIELMQTHENRNFFKENHLSNKVIEASLKEQGWIAAQRGALSGPAIEYSHPNYAGRIGLISPYSKDFCHSCNRLRVDSVGGLKLCLFGDGEISLRQYLQSPSQTAELVAAIGKIIVKKPEAHKLEENNFGNTRNFSQIGG